MAQLSTTFGLLLVQGARLVQSPPGRGAEGSLAARVRNALDDFLSLARPDERASPGAPAGDAALEAAVGAARQAAEDWRRRAEAGEQRVKALEAQLAASEMTALELRSRIVCLQGKLAASSATARYQVLAMELGAPAGAETPPTSR